MFLAASLLTNLFLALSIVATPVEVRSSRVTLPLARLVNIESGPINLVESGQARVAALKECGATLQKGTLSRRTSSIPIVNEDILYFAAVAVGSPSTTYNLAIDIGSANTWVGPALPFTPTSTSADTGEPMSLSYGSAAWTGELWLDQVSIGPDLTIAQQPIGVANITYNLVNIEGILALGPEILTLGTLVNENTTLIPTVTQNLYSQGTITEEVFALSFAPTNNASSTNGELTFGGIDPSKYTGALAYTPLTTTLPAAYYWGLNQSITYGGTTILSDTAGIVDAGTTMIFIASDAYSAYQSATGATYDSTTHLLSLTPAQYFYLQDLNFQIGSTTYALTPNGQIWPRSLNTYIGGVSSSIYLIVCNIGYASGQGLDFFLGLTFLERFYSVFDTTNSQIGFATTPYTDAWID